MGKLIIAALVLVGIAVLLFARRKSSATFEVGGIYSIDEGGGRYGVVKLLVHAAGICHVRVYKQNYSARPATIDVASLSLGKPGDPDGFGMGHMPVREAGFLEWKPVLIATIKVTPDELEGYEIWKESGGGAF